MTAFLLCPHTVEGTKELHKFRFFKDFIYLCLERGREKERERNITVREKHPLVVSHTCPNQELNPQPRHIP